MSLNLPSLLTSVVPFGISMGITPGPNNFLLANSSAAFGTLRTLPLMAGIVIGFSFLTLVLGLGAATIFQVAPQLFAVLRMTSVAYMLYLAYAIATSAAHRSRGLDKKPLTFLQGAAFQWVNPKAWAVAVGATSLYASLASDLRAQVVIISGVFLLTGTFVTAVWMLLGHAIGRLIETDRQLKIFNGAMALLLLLSIVPMMFDI